MKTFNQLKKNLKKNFTSLQPIKLALLGDNATQFISIALRGWGYEADLDIKIFEADYNQVEQNILNSESDLYQFKPEFVWIVLSAQKLQQKFYKLNLAEKETFCEDMCSHLNFLYETVQTNFACKLILNNFIEADDKIFGSYATQVPSSWLYQIRKLNFEMMNLARQNQNLFLNDILSVQNSRGYARVHDSKLWIASSMAFNIDSLVPIVKSSVDIINCHLGKFKKCIILDLDNTLWGGVVGDDGLEGIELGDLGIGKAFVEFQSWLLQLKLRGILLAVCSKNEESIAKEVFEKHGDMILHLEDISYFVANWNNKVDNIREIQQVLNIGFDSMVFLDDNPFERNLVGENIPGITIPEMPEDPVEYVDYLRSLNLFETLSFTATDKDRTASIQIESRRKILQKSFTNQDDFYSLFILVLVFWLLHIGKSMLIPFVLAFFIWYMINVLAQVIRKIPIKEKQIPTPVSYILAISLITGIISLLLTLITNNFSQIAKLAPDYQENVSRMVVKFFQYLPVNEPPPITSILEQLNFGSLLSQFALTITSLTGNLGLVLIYLIFIFLEQKSFQPKLKALLARNSSMDEVDLLLKRIDSDIRKYLGIKTFTSALTGILSYSLMKIIGLDFAEFWAIMIFVLNYIPTFGSIVAVIFPISLAFVQFASIYMFFVTGGGLILIQFIIGNILDPRLLGNTLNLSPIMILLSLTLWGSIWGPAGMILCVPLMAILIIVLSHFPRTEALAILLSKDGKFKKV